jgi:hypothetical protein
MNISQNMRGDTSFLLGIGPSKQDTNNQSIIEELENN